MSIRITETHNEYRLAGTLSHMDTGGSPCTIEIYGNTRPTNIDDAAGATPLVIIELADPSGTIDGGVLTLIAGDDQLVLASGVAVWGRCVNGAGATSWDADVSDPGGTATIKLPDTTLYAGGVTRLVSGQLG